MRTLLPLLLLICSALVGCGESNHASMARQDSDVEPEEGSTCTYDGEVYAAGDVIRKSSGVSCVCLESGELGQCTGVLDETDAGEQQGDCSYEGAAYAVGDIVWKGPHASCLCLEGGELGQCTGVIPDDER